MMNNVNYDATHANTERRCISHKRCIQICIEFKTSIRIFVLGSRVTPLIRLLLCVIELCVSLFEITSD